MKNFMKNKKKTLKVCAGIPSQEIPGENNVTELVFIIDRSGSMAGLERDTVGGFNAMIKSQKEKSGKCYVSTVLFDHECLVLHDRVDLEEIDELSEKDYRVRGSTALVDAIGGAIHHIGNVHKYARKEDVPEHTMFVITTDGMENSSHNYTSDRVKKMIETQKSEHGWEFLFLGANIDAVETAKHFGIDEDRAVNYKSDGKGTRLNYEAVSDAVSTLRENRRLDGSWRKKIDRDFKSRKKPGI